MTSAATAGAVAGRPVLSEGEGDRAVTTGACTTRRPTPRRRQRRRHHGGLAGCAATRAEASGAATTPAAVRDQRAVSDADRRRVEGDQPARATATARRADVARGAARRRLATSTTLSRRGDGTGDHDVATRDHE